LTATVALGGTMNMHLCNFDSWLVYRRIDANVYQKSTGRAPAMP
jgi:hypothetical protein